MSPVNCQTLTSHVNSSLHCFLNLCRGQKNEPASTQSTIGRGKKLTKRRHWLINIKTQDGKDEIEDEGDEEYSNHGNRQQITYKTCDQKGELVSQASTSKPVSCTPDRILFLNLTLRCRNCRFMFFLNWWWLYFNHTWLLVIELREGKKNYSFI